MRLFLNKEQWTKLITGAALGAFGFVATFVTEYLTGATIPEDLKPAVITAWSFVANYIRKVLAYADET